MEKKEAIEIINNQKSKIETLTHELKLLEMKICIGCGYKRFFNKRVFEAKYSCMIRDILDHEDGLFGKIHLFYYLFIDLFLKK